MGDTNDKQFKKLIQDVADIKDALLGTPYIKKGLVKRVEDLERDMQNLNIIKWKITGASAGIASVVSIVAGIILKFIIG